MVEDIDWSPIKDTELQQRYGIGFRHLVATAKRGGLLMERRHPNAQRYPNQYQWIIDLDGYAWVMPFVRNEGGMFLKTFFPSRKATRDFLGAGSL